MWTVEAMHACSGDGSLLAVVLHSMYVWSRTCHSVCSPASSWLHSKAAISSYPLLKRLWLGPFVTQGPRVREHTGREADAKVVPRARGSENVLLSRSSARVRWHLATGRTCVHEAARSELSPVLPLAHTRSL